MGGSLGYEDNLGGGSVFSLELPLRASAADTAPQAAGAASLPGTRPMPEALAPLRVLVVDDVAMNRDIAQAFLRAAVHEVATAESGVKTIIAVANTGFDVVLMDVRMPGMYGLEATRRIRALAAPHGQVPVIALTAQAFAEQLEACRQAGMDGHLTKLFTPGSLLNAVRQRVRNRMLVHTGGA